MNKTKITFFFTRRPKYCSSFVSRLQQKIFSLYSFNFLTHNLFSSTRSHCRSFQSTETSFFKFKIIIHFFAWQWNFSRIDIFHFEYIFALFATLPMQKPFGTTSSSLQCIVSYLPSTCFKTHRLIQLLFFITTFSCFFLLFQKYFFRLKKLKISMLTVELIFILKWLL